MTIKTMIRVLKSGNAFKFNERQKRILEYCTADINDEEVLYFLTNPNFSAEKMYDLYRAYRKKLSLNDLKFLAHADENKTFALTDSIIKINDKKILKILRDKNFSPAQIFEINDAFKTLPKEKFMLLLDPKCPVTIMKDIYEANFEEDIENYLKELSKNKKIYINYYINLFKYGFTLDEVKYIESLALEDKYLNLIANDFYIGYISKENILSLSKEHLIILLEQIEIDKKQIHNKNAFDEYNIDLEALKDNSNKSDEINLQGKKPVK